ncbi:hypothetical protein GQF01_02085 [Paenibacillus sp. 5J-6]|uniref:Uncharacterized protein n=1 Tax=Paenibacillus silvestris TaxID=2606219 RepID=A0A6L8UUV4_9BACL|nr:hypothetical protein [Paenibacillus silvestris]MZQ80929.1 hypothetical protein [Paenibacillus silvestris]
MIKLDKGIEKYNGTPPYASEMYGNFTPFLGWESKLTKQWIQRGGLVVDSRMKQIFDGRIAPESMNFISDALDVFEITSLLPGKEKSPYKVFLTKDLKSELFNLLREKVQAFIDAPANNGKLPSGDQWEEIVKELKLKDEHTTALRTVSQTLTALVKEQLNFEAARTHQSAAVLSNKYRQKYLEIMKYESQIAGFLLMCINKEAGLSPDDLTKLFDVKTAAPISDIFRSNDPLANLLDPLAAIDPRNKDGALSPIGRIDLFRQCFFDLGSFLGEPVEHVWLAPGTTIELYEVSTRKTVIERTLESSTETTSRSDDDTTDKDEISDAVKAENRSSTKMGVSASTTGKTFFGQSTASANFSNETNQSNAKETMHKQSREQTHKLSNEIKQSFKSTFKTTTEVTDMTSRRHIIVNPNNTLINYELRRKMRRIGVQTQHIGQQLCWQMFIDDPGAQLGLAELVHMSESPDLSNLSVPVEIPPPTNELKTFTVPFPYMPILDYHDNQCMYLFQGHAIPTDDKSPLLGRRHDVGDDNDSQLIIEFTCTLDAPPKQDYELDKNSIRLKGVPSHQRAVVRTADIVGDNNLHIVLDQVHFAGENFVKLDFEMVYTPSQAAKDAVIMVNTTNRSKYDSDRNEITRKAYADAVRKRISDASNIKPRPSWDLREEERIVVYRKLIERLMLDSWDLKKSSNNPANDRLAHVRSEIVRSLFDVDGMLYFVAPEWWMPRMHSSQMSLSTDLITTSTDINNITNQTPITLTEKDVVKWTDSKNSRDANYRITEESSAARLGSSLGWLLQLDGDNLRNAFLNAPWVKAVIPIRSGREKAALNWLKSINDHENDGWDNDYLGTESRFVDKKIGEVLEIVADEMEQANRNFKSVLESDQVYEHGFSHLAGGFDESLDSSKPFTQAITILPTDQIVAVEYEPMNLLVEDED